MSVRAAEVLGRVSDLLINGSGQRVLAMPFPKTFQLALPERSSPDRSTRPSVTLSLPQPFHNSSPDPLSSARTFPIDNLLTVIHTGAISVLRSRSITIQTMIYETSIHDLQLQAAVLALLLLTCTASFSSPVRPD
ncbi:hypothetical protein BaRGS_00016119 [Batillaria attramentaria]|uniref:Uncharacterized protein n=1 Tax=Batillaria attramentaria TaxID=370345 RepID=A0ABD0L0J5_9CAEN